MESTLYSTGQAEAIGSEHIFSRPSRVPACQRALGVDEAHARESDENDRWHAHCVGLLCDK
jgi:hypothetical protein